MAVTPELPEPPRHANAVMLTMSEVRAVLGVSRTRVLAIVEKGQLRAYKDRVAKKLLFEREAVFKLAGDRAEKRIRGTKRGSIAELDGALVARVFSYFTDGWTIGQIVIEEQLSPGLVRSLFVEYTTPLGQQPPRQATRTVGRPRSVPIEDTKHEPVESVLRAIGGALKPIARRKLEAEEA